MPGRKILQKIWMSHTHVFPRRREGVRYPGGAGEGPHEGGLLRPHQQRQVHCRQLPAGGEDPPHGDRTHHQLLPPGSEISLIDFCKIFSRGLWKSCFHLGRPVFSPFSISPYTTWPQNVAKFSKFKKSLWSGKKNSMTSIISAAL